MDTRNKQMHAVYDKEINVCPCQYKEKIVSIRTETL